MTECVLRNTSEHQPMSARHTKLSRVISLGDLAMTLATTQWFLLTRRASTEGHRMSASSLQRRTVVINQVLASARVTRIATR